MEKTPAQDTFNLSKIKCIVGLGNPGPQYRKTRHNAGFIFLDEIFEKYGQGSQWDTRTDTCLTTISIPLISGQMHQITLLKPMTGMNISGIHIKSMFKKGIKPEQIIVCYDELEKPFGKSMLRFSGSARGHNGVRSTIEQIGTQFWQLRIGIDRPENRKDVANYVLGNFTPIEQEKMSEMLIQTMKLIGL